MKVRIDLSKIKLYQLTTKPDYDTSVENPENTDTSVQNNTFRKTPLDEVRIDLSISPRPLNLWTSPTSGYPQGNVDFNVPKDAMDEAVGWFTGKYNGADSSPNQTLLNNVTTAARNTLNSYLEAAAQSNLATAPFLAGWALRDSSGKRNMFSSMQLLIPNDRSPLLNIADYNIGTYHISSLVNIINYPSALQFRIQDNPSEIDWKNFEYIDFIAAPQPNLIPDDFHINSVGSVNINDTPLRCYLYARPESESLLATASLQNDYRIIASISVKELQNQTTPTDIPIINGAFNNWKLLEKYKDGDSEDNNDSSDKDYECIWYPYINIETEPLHLGSYEERKRVKSVCLHGIYQRDKISIGLYGSRHRENWQLIATGKRGWISGLHGAPFRWWKIRINGPVRKKDLIEALTFNIY